MDLLSPIIIIILNKYVSLGDIMSESTHSARLKGYDREVGPNFGTTRTLGQPGPWNPRITGPLGNPVYRNSKTKHPKTLKLKYK